MGTIIHNEILYLTVKGGFKIVCCAATNQGTHNLSMWNNNISQCALSSQEIFQKTYFSLWPSLYGLKKRHLDRILLIFLHINQFVL
jgi:hypothetical protein